MTNQHMSLGLLVTALLFFAGGHSDAASWRINNNANRHAHFTDINAAMSSSDVHDGDTLYIDPGCTLTSAQTISKSITVIGCGYGGENRSYGDAIIKAQINITAPNTTIKSMVLSNNGSNSTGTIYLSADNVTIERCLLNTFIQWNGVGRNFTLRQCISSHTITGAGINSANSEGCRVVNCIFLVNYTKAIITALKAPVIRYCYIRNVYSGTNYPLLSNLSDATITDNILLHVNTPEVVFYNVDGSISHNVLSCSEGTYSNVTASDNKLLGEADESKIFLMNTDDDYRFQLCDDSPAKGYAVDGGDCGPFSGPYPFVVWGYPLGIPHFNISHANTLAKDGKVSFTNEVTIQKQ